MNWTGSASTGAARRAWSCVTGDLVTSTEEWAKPKRKRSSFSFRKPGYPCGNAGIGRLLHFMGKSCGPGVSEQPLNSLQSQEPDPFFTCRKPARNFGIDLIGCSVQLDGSRIAPRVGRRHE